MKYEFGYAISALAFLSVVAFHFFKKRRYPNLQNRIYAVVMVLALCDLILDIAGSYTIMNATQLPPWVNHLLNTPFYFIQSVITAFLMLYVMAVADEITRENRIRILFTLIPAFLSAAVLFTNPMTGLIFYVDDKLGYMRGPMFNFLYTGTVFYFIAAVVVLFWNKPKFSKIQYKTIEVLVLFCIIGVSIQYFFPEYLLTGMVIALSITMLFFTMQIPEDMLDVTTGAFNLNALLEFIDKGYKSKRKYIGFAVILDDLFNISENLGLASGNEALRSMAEYLSKIANKGWVFRMSGSIYVVLTEDSECYNEALAKISGRINHAWNILGEEIILPISICTFSDPKFVTTSAKFTRLIETSFYTAKIQGKTGVTEISAEAVNALDRYTQVEMGMNEALANDGFELYLQPIYSTRENRFVSAEALLRFNHPKLGKLSPEEFIPIAEANGTIINIDRYMLKKVVQFIKSYDPIKEFNLELIEVNLSTIDLLQDSLYEDIIKIIEEEQVDFGAIGLEITESGATKFTDAILSCIRALDGKGIKILLDDFGAGYSNISKISHLPLYAVKMDKSMFSSYLSSWQSATVFEDIIKMCRRLGFLIVVEGVDTEIQAELLHKLKVDLIQGFYYARPMPAKEFIEFLKQRNS